ncbi:MAG: hybrid sensor histidine kinase/response regulator [Microscillaceae bacterium]|jgi:signal transduction histidine kinase|nr:hybrid sensor histidine kinase/response regulator [Microscillaceae bacterium]
MNKILLVEEKLDDINLIIKYLRETNIEFEFYTTDKVSEGIVLAIDKLPDVIIVDMRLAFGSEINFVQHLKKQAHTQNTPIMLAIEKTDSEQNIADFLNLGATDYIRKPIRKNSLVARVNAALRLAKVYQEIKVSRQQLDDLHTEQMNLMGIVAHDLKSPLNKVQGLIQLMPLVGELNDEQKSYVEMINRVIAGGRRLIDDILTINEAGDHLQPLQLETVDLKEFLEDILATYHQTAQAKKLALHFKMADEISLQTDRECLSRVMDNLLSNAIKFSYPDKNVFVSVSQTDQEVKISVRDEGQGISEDDKKKMFQKFQKLSAKPTAGETSTGLGLSIIKTLVEKLAGEIHFSSVLGVGTEFQIDLPKQIA